MKFKKSLLAICLIVLLFSIASVSANNIDDNSIALEENAINTLEENANSIDLDDSLSISEVNKNELSSFQEETISNTQEETVANAQEETISNTQEETVANGQEEIVSNAQEERLGDAQNEALVDDGTFTALQKKIDNAESGAVISLDKDYTYDAGFDTRGIQIKKDLTINGNGHVLNGLSQSRILLIHFGAIANNKVTLNNIKFINGNTKLYGGAIFNYAELTVNNCVFENNYAKYCGGAINSIGHLDLMNSKFNKNTAGGDAGAVFTLSIDKSVEFFKKIYVDKVIFGDMDFISETGFELGLGFGTDNIKNCIFTNNVAKGRGGGAIYGFTHLNIDSSTFTSNQAGEDGGAVFANKDLKITNSKFTSNKASKRGGAVYFRCHQQSGSYVNGVWTSQMKYYSASISNSAFTKNSAKKGGAIYGFISTNADKKRLKVNKCTFEDNSASTGRDVLGGTCSNCVYRYIKLASKNKTIKKTAKKLTLSAKLTKGKTVLKNKKITFKFKGKTYTAKTNKKGIAKVTIKKSVLKTLKAGKKYTVKISYLKDSIKRTVKVKK